jgi:Fur family transcriptional regulator, iron response regulator
MHRPQTSADTSIVHPSEPPAIINDALQRLVDGKPAVSGCPFQQVRSRLVASGLRPTRQRILLGWLLLGQGHRHVSAEQLFEEARRAKVHLSLATVYNTLRQFSEVSLIRQVLSEGGKAYFDTNVDEHHHYMVEGEDEMWDAPVHAVPLAGAAVAPPGFEVAGVDVVVRLRRLPVSA